jgi:hypothetical protein
MNTLYLRSLRPRDAPRVRQDPSPKDRYTRFACECFLPPHRHLWRLHLYYSVFLQPLSAPRERQPPAGDRYDPYERRCKLG